MTGFTFFWQCRSGSVQAVLLATALSVMLLGCANSSGTQDAPTRAVALGPHDTLIVAGGCFWCVEFDFDAISGVLDTTSGYTGGTVPNATYRQVSAGGTGHREAVRIAFDPEQVTTEELLTVFWRSIDPTDEGGQFCDRGFEYTSAIYARDEQQQAIAEASRQALADSGVLDEPIVTAIEPAGEFWPAEHYHQDFYKKNPLRYHFYRLGCRRDARLKALWGVSG